MSRQHIIISSVVISDAARIGKILPEKEGIVTQFAGLLCQALGKVISAERDIGSSGCG
jgi:hypothetical protein